MADRGILRRQLGRESLSFYLNGYVGLGVFLASSFSTIMRLWDGVTDPIVGFVVDKFGQKAGKTRL